MARPVTVAVDPVAAAATVTVDLPTADAETVYPVTAAPPVETGADHVTTTDPDRPSTDVINGADGTCATNGTTGPDAGLAGLDPPAFTADTRTV